MGECKQCGACCRKLIVEIEKSDIQREPKLAETAEKYKEEDRYLLACGIHKPCIFLKDNKCSIYPTRPEVCRAMEPGGVQCEMARWQEGKRTRFAQVENEGTLGTP